MPVEIRMPDLDATGDRVKLVSWLKEEGESVKRGEPLCEVESDKAVVVLESVAEGVLLRRVAPLDTEIEQGTVIAYVGQAGEFVPEPAAQPATPEAPQEAGRPSAPASASVSPMIRNLAKRLKVDLDRVEGSGPGGRILREDILRAKQAASAAGGELLSANQLAVARRVSQSHREIPAISLTARIGMSSAMRLRQHVQETSGEKVAYEALFLFALARVLPNFAHFRSRLDGERVVLSAEVNIGFAVSSEKGLYVPVVKNVDTKSLEEINVEVHTLAEKAASGKLSLAEVAGGVMTISNLGMYPVQSFTAIIPPQQVATLAVGCVEEAPGIQEGTVDVRPMVSVTLTVDHRLINGMEAARFLTLLKEFVETL